MPNPHQLNAEEAFWLISLLLLFVLDLNRIAQSRDRLGWLQPLPFVMAFLGYYIVIGPLDRLISGDWTDRGRDFRYALSYALAGATLFYGAVSLGFHQLRSWKPLRRFSTPQAEACTSLLGQRLCWIGLAAYGLVSGPRLLVQLNPFGAREAVLTASGGIDLGAFINYANNSLNLLIPGVLLLFVSWLRQRRTPGPLILWTLVSVSLFTTLGFRYRLVTLAVPMAVLWFLASGKRPSLILLSLGGLGLFLVSGVIGLTRAYGLGLDLTSLQGLTFGEIFRSGFQETHVFLITGAVIENSPGTNPFVGLQPLISTLLIPIPRAFLAEKTTADYVFKATQSLFPVGSEHFASGAAFLNVAEYYLMGGWISLLAMGVAIGGLLRCLWNWFTVRRTESLAQVAYVCAVGYLCVVISRGYLAQVVTLFVFGVAPLFALYYWQARPRPMAQVSPAVQSEPTTPSR
jgi:hypothetical protein